MGCVGMEIIYNWKIGQQKISTFSEKTNYLVFFAHSSGHIFQNSLYVKNLTLLHKKIQKTILIVKCVRLLLH